MSELKIIATIVAKPETKDVIYKALTDVVDSTRKEEGNISYILHSDIKTPLKYVILEHWSSQEAIDIHNETEHFKTFVSTITDKIESLDISIIEAIY